MAALVCRDLGRLEYLAALEYQEKVVLQKQHGPMSDVLIFVEHPHVVTLGRAGKEHHVVAAGGLPVHRTSRGGDVTYHGPGQLVIYPIVDLRSKLRKDVHRYLHNLEQTAIQTLADFGLETERKPPFTGIWIANRKIAAIGVAVRRGITLHGLALNVNTDLSYFSRIVPCGLSWAGVTSMERELGARQDLSRVKHVFSRFFAAIFGYDDMRGHGGFSASEALELLITPESENPQLQS